MLRAFLERRRLRKALGRYFSPDVGRQLADGSPEMSDSVYTQRNVEVALVAISAADATSFSKISGVVVASEVRRAKWKILVWSQKPKG